jgi:nudix motif 8
VHHPNRKHPVKPEDPFPSLDMSTIRQKLPTVEVGAAFHLPLSALVEPTRRRQDMFREGRPYWAISVADLLQDVQPSIVDVNEQKDADHIVDSNKLEEELEVWGLTGWYLSLVMKILNI